MTQAVAVMTELQRLFAQAPDRDWAGTAVIAREWKYLEPVRSYCELNHIPVQMADEEAPHFWRLRETQALVGWLRADRMKLVDTGAIGHWLARQSAGPWCSLLRQAVAEYEKVGEMNAKSGKIPDALLKIGLCYRALNDPARAREAWQQLVQAYPDSEAARQARTLIGARAVPVRRAR